MAYNAFHNHAGPRSQISFQQQTDHRLPPPGNYPTQIMSFQDRLGFDTHLLRLLPPESPKIVNLLEDSRAKRQAHAATPAHEIVSRAAFPSTGVEATLKHISDGPRGGIWVLAKGKEEVLTCLLDELEELRIQRKGVGKGKEPDFGGWQVLGLGAKMWEGSVFLIHPCGPGGPPIEDGQGKG